MESLSKIGKFLGWKEFVVAFLFFAFSASLPNLFVGIVSALNGISQLSLGDVIGGNILDLTLVAGLATLISKAGISAPSRTVQNSALFLILITILFSFLVADNLLSRLDGFLLFLIFIGYLIWLFIKKERFRKIYDSIQEELSIKFFLKNLGLFFLSLILILASSQGIVVSTKFLSNFFRFPLWFVGLLIVSFGNALPELVFSIECARKDQDWLILGDLIGSVIISTTLVLGIVALISPIQIENLSAILISRVFLLISAFFFLFLLRSGKKITEREGIILILIYFLFLIVEILVK
jgi:cation:H+ antiporter